MVLFSASIFMVSWIDLIDRAVTGTGESSSSPSSRLGKDGHTAQFSPGSALSVCAPT